jgi:predicted DNA-binding transcriptional regulator AlpA
MEYVSFGAAARLIGLSKPRIEQLIRLPESQFPRPFQPSGEGGRRFFKAAELTAWLEGRRAKYS